MIEIYTEQEMLDKWRLHCHMGPERTDAPVVRRDFLDLDTLMLDQMKGWYRRMLETAPVECIGVTQLSGTVRPQALGNGVFEVVLPSGVVRVLEVKLTGWERQAQIVEADTPEAAAQCNIYSRGGKCRPVAVRHNDRLTLYSLPDAGAATLSSLSVVMDDGVYRLDESLFDNIKKYDGD